MKEDYWCKEILIYKYPSSAHSHQYHCLSKPFIFSSYLFRVGGFDKRPFSRKIDSSCSSTRSLFFPDKYVTTLEYSVSLTSIARKISSEEKCCFIPTRLFPCWR